MIEGGVFFFSLSSSQDNDFEDVAVEGERIIQEASNVLENGDELCRYIGGFRDDDRKFEGLYVRIYSKV